MSKQVKVTLKDKLGLGFALVIIGLIFTLGNPQGIPNFANYSFADEPVEVRGFEVSAKEADLIPLRVIVPSLGIDLEVAEASIVGGYWEVFPDKAGWGEGSGVPGEPGNQVIFAHAQEGLFLPLKDIKVGETIYVLARSTKGGNDSWYSYKIEEINEVLPHQTEVIEPTSDETLTLYTCSGFNYNKRLIVTGKRI
jgi:sortase A